MNQETAEQFLKFFHFAERTKKTFRHCWTSKPHRHESIAEHSYRMALMALLLTPELSQKINVEKLLKIILIHDLPEAITGDIPYWLTVNNPKIKKQKIVDENKAINKMISMLPGKSGTELKNLWQEYEDRKTPESKLAKILDRLDTRFQHVEEGIKRWHKEEYKLESVKRMNNNLDTSGIKEVEPLIKASQKEMINEYKKNNIKMQ